MRIPTIIGGLLFSVGLLGAAEFDYKDAAAIKSALEEIARDNSSLARVKSLTTNLSVLELGKTTNAPGLLVVAGIEPFDVYSPVVALRVASDLVRNTNNLLEKYSVYIVPFAQQGYFSKPQQVSQGSPVPVDDDKDGLMDEDGAEDLDGNEVITTMRVKDPGGEYIADPGDSRLLIRADKAKGERGEWKLLVEGKDNDGDEAWNEDSVGGVNFNRNWPHNYRYFGAQSGLHPISEPETRALIDFVLAHPNIAIAFTFGGADNLIQTPKGEGTNVRVPTTIKEEDVPFYRELGKQWRDALGIKKELTGGTEPGSFSDWFYYQRGRLSLAARPWNPAMQAELDPKVKAPKKEEPKKEDKSQEEAKSEEKKEEKKEDSKKEDAKKEDERNKEERAFLKWFDQFSTNSFIPWQKFDHPDFSGKKVEIGGFLPFAKTVPPEIVATNLAPKQAAYLLTLLDKLPRLDVQEVKVTDRGNSVFDVKVNLANEGYLPTSLQMGGLTREVLPIKAELQIAPEKLLAGQRVTLLRNLAGKGGSQELQYTIHSSTNVTLKVTSEFAGSTNLVIKLAK